MSGNREKVVALQRRDQRLLSELSVMRIVDREQAKVVAGFASTTRANARLLALTKGGYLRRSFVGTIGGGRKAIYRLSEKAIQAGYAGAATGRDHSALFLEHQLLINEVYIEIKYRPIPMPECTFHQWTDFTGTLSKTTMLIPDGYFELRHHSVVKSVFLEVDLGTEAGRIWQKKIDGYLKLALSGEFQKLFGQSQFKVAVIAGSGRRVENIRRLAAKFTDKIFRFTTFESIKREGLWSAIWLRPAGDQRVPLL